MCIKRTIITLSITLLIGLFSDALAQSPQQNSEVKIYTLADTQQEMQKREQLYITSSDTISLSDASHNYLSHILSIPLVSRPIKKDQGIPPFDRPLITTILPQPGNIIPVPQISIGFNQRLVQEALNHLQHFSPELFAYGADFLSQYRTDYIPIGFDKNGMKLNEYEQLQKSVGQSVEPLLVREAPTKHWIPVFESSIQFSQNFVSNNWYKGGAGNLNLFLRNYFAYNYIANKINWTNEFESKLSIYNAQDDSVHRYRIADDLLRLHSNFGYRAIKRWYYTLDWEVRTQLFHGYKQNSRRLASSWLSPLHSIMGLGMKYEYKNFDKAIYGKKIKFTLNLAPISYTMRSAINPNIELERHGLSSEQMIRHTIGSTISSELQWDFNLTIGWRSRFNYNTNYKQVESEWENTFNFNFNRFFSTKLYLYLRFDDSVPPSSDWMKYIQINELISLGFNFRL